MLQRAEGPYLRGYGDRSRRPWEPGPLTVVDEGRDGAARLSAATSRLDADLDEVEQVVTGFEGAWGMELLSTVHWVASEDKAAANPDEARERIASWSMRKNRIFPSGDVEAAWEHLEQRGWLAPAAETRTLFDG